MEKQNLYKEKKRQEGEKLIEKCIDQALIGLSLRLYLLEISRGRLGVYLDKKDGTAANLLECEAVSKRIALFMEASRVRHNFKLEVSSPGLNRKLKYPWHFKNALGQTLSVTLSSPKRTFLGVLKEVKDHAIVIENQNSRNLEIIEFSHIERACVHFVIEPPKKKLKKILQKILKKRR